MCNDVEADDCYSETTRSRCCFTCLDYYQQNAHLNGMFLLTRNFGELK